MKKSFMLGAAVVCLAVAGCQNTVNTIENADKSATYNVIRDSRFVTDGFLKDRLALVRIIMSENSDGFMQAQVEAVNVRTGVLDQLWSGITEENPYKIRYKFTWFDQNGMAMESVISDWQDATVIPGESVYLKSVAPSRDCRDFKVSLKEAQ